MCRGLLVAAALAMGGTGSAIAQDLPNAPATQTEQAPIPEIPNPVREFRGVWVATVANIDWPSKPGLSTADQQKEALAILDKCVDLKLNVVVLQIRTSCDALYKSDLEPWSYFLTGEQGKAPDPYYDPLEFWVDEAHKRGLELHAWFNPFRAKASGQRYTESDKHISKTQPDLVKTYGNNTTRYLWLDPGEDAAREHSLNVFLDVVKRYDIDGVHIDDYFYPYPVDNIPFPDDPAYKKYTDGGGKLARDDWRRHTMNEFIKELYARIKQEKPHVKFGISPFGIWQPGHPASVRGFNQYEKLYADAKLWLNEGWCDYYTPQLYWPITAPQQSFPALLGWWAEQNTQKRVLAPGIFTSRVGDKSRPYSVDQIQSKVYTARYFPGASGVIHFSMIALMQNREGLADELKKGAYAQPALIPLSPWLEGKAPNKPTIGVRVNAARGDQRANVRVTWRTGGGSKVWQWAVYVCRGNEWTLQVLPAGTSELTIEQTGTPIRAVAVSALDRLGNESERAMFEMKKD